MKIKLQAKNRCWLERCDTAYFILTYCTIEVYKKYIDDLQWSHPFFNVPTACLVNAYVFCLAEFHCIPCEFHCIPWQEVTITEHMCLRFLESVRLNSDSQKAIDSLIRNTPPGPRERTASYFTNTTGTPRWRSFGVSFLQPGPVTLLNPNIHN